MRVCQDAEPRLLFAALHVERGEAARAVASADGPQLSSATDPTTEREIAPPKQLVDALAKVRGG